jgi:molybdenum cofactor biosynthesis enzyme MoaA
MACETIENPSAAEAMRHLILSVGRSCFTRCRGCYNHFGAHGSPLIEREVVLEFLTAVRQTPLRKVTVGGGDPLSRPDIIELLDCIHQLGFTINLDTVGTALIMDAQTIFFGRKTVQQLSLARLRPAIDRLGIPLDGPTDEVATQFRSGRPDLIEETQRVLQEADREGVVVTVNTVVGGYNVDHLGAILHMLGRHPCVTEWQLFQFMPIGPLGFGNRRSFQLPDDAFAAGVDSVTELSDRLGLPLRINPKSCRSRKNLYLLVNDDGTAWTPRSSSDYDWDPAYDVTSDRNVLGSIRRREDVPNIVRSLYSRENPPWPGQGELGMGRPVAA